MLDGAVPEPLVVTVTQTMLPDGRVQTQVRGPDDLLVKLNVLHQGQAVILGAMMSARMADAGFEAPPQELPPRIILARPGVN